MPGRWLACIGLRCGQLPSCSLCQSSNVSAISPLVLLAQYTEHIAATVKRMHAAHTIRSIILSPGPLRALASAKWYEVTAGRPFQ